MPFVVPSRPCEHPDPAVSAYKSLPMNLTSETPLTRLFCAALVSLEGRPSMTLVTLPWGSILEMRDVYPPVYGPTGARTWSLGHISIVDVVPPAPPSATYKY